MQLGMEQMRFRLAELFFLTLLFFSYLTRYMQAVRLVRLFAFRNHLQLIFTAWCGRHNGVTFPVPPRKEAGVVCPLIKNFPPDPSQLQKLLAVI